MGSQTSTKLRVDNFTVISALRKTILFLLQKMLTKFATTFLSAASAGRLARSVNYDCPNPAWEPVLLADTGVQVQNSETGELSCQPRSDSYEIKCSATGIEVNIKYGLLFEAFDAAPIAQSLREEPAMLGNCAGSVPVEFGDFGYQFKVDIPEGAHTGFQGQVSPDLIAAQFQLNKYTETWSE